MSPENESEQERIDREARASLEREQQAYEHSPKQQTFGRSAEEIAEINRQDARFGKTSAMGGLLTLSGGCALLVLLTGILLLAAFGMICGPMMSGH